MDLGQRIEFALDDAVNSATQSQCPPRLAAALLHAVFPGGARVRPRLCLAVARACGDNNPEFANRAAASIEILHCASLVHDDMPCFDNSEIRRGRPAVHKAFGEPIALLAGDALIVLAFQVLGRCVELAPDRASAIFEIIGQAVGAPNGIIAGQALECETDISLPAYHRAKTGSLFVAATTAGALGGGGRYQDWRRLGERLGEAYQIADDICDLVADPHLRGKPGNKDGELGRPNAAGLLGVEGAIARLKTLLSDAVDSVPPCPGMDALRTHILKSAQPYLPKELAVVPA